MKVGIKKDKEKASSLLEMAKTTYERLKETNINKYPTNTFKD